MKRGAFRRASSELSRSRNDDPMTKLVAPVEWPRLGNVRRKDDLGIRSKELQPVVYVTGVPGRNRFADQFHVLLRHRLPRESHGFVVFRSDALGDRDRLEDDGAGRVVELRRLGDPGRGEHVDRLRDEARIDGAVGIAARLRADPEGVGLGGWERSHEPGPARSRPSPSAPRRSSIRGAACRGTTMAR